jgi:hypothetical protein
MFGLPSMYGRNTRIRSFASSLQLKVDLVEHLWAQSHLNIGWNKISRYFDSNVFVIFCNIIVFVYVSIFFPWLVIFCGIHQWLKKMLLVIFYGFFHGQSWRVIVIFHELWWWLEEEVACDFLWDLAMARIL